VFRNALRGCKSN